MKRAKARLTPEQVGLRAAAGHHLNQDKYMLKWLVVAVLVFFSLLVPLRFVTYDSINNDNYISVLTSDTETVQIEHRNGDYLLNDKPADLNSVSEDKQEWLAIPVLLIPLAALLLVYAGIGKRRMNRRIDEFVAQHEIMIGLRRDR